MSESKAKEKRKPSKEDCIIMAISNLQAAFTAIYAGDARSGAILVDLSRSNIMPYIKEVRKKYPPEPVDEAGTILKP